MGTSNYSDEFQRDAAAPSLVPATDQRTKCTKSATDGLSDYLERP